MAELLFQSKQEKLADGSPIIITKILGAIDGTTVRQFEDKLIGFFNQGVKNLILIFSDVKYINSTGMGLLVKLADKFQEGGGDIKLVGVPEKVITLFDMLGLLSLFKIYETEEDAIDSISADGGGGEGMAPPAMVAPPPPPPATIAPKAPPMAAPPPPAKMAPPKAPPPVAAPAPAPRAAPKSDPPAYIEEGFALGGGIVPLEEKAPAKKSGTELVFRARPEEVILRKKKVAEEPKPAARPETATLEVAPEVTFPTTKIEESLEVEDRDLLEKEISATVSAEVPKFEQWLSDEAGAPGAFERFAAQFVWLMRLIYKTAGLSFVLLINTTDRIIAIINSYINGVFQSWKMYRTIQKRLQQRDPDAQIQSVICDFNVGRIQLARLFSFSQFFLEEHTNKVKEEIVSPTFSLKLVIELRGHLDQMKRDLAILNIDEAKKTAQKSVLDFFKSFIPNPLELFDPIKDFFILGFMMKYSRREIEQMYIDFVVSYQSLLDFLQQDCKEDHSNTWEAESYEINIVRRTVETEAPQGLSQAIEECRNKLQRLIQMLCNPKRFIYPDKWEKIDLLWEVKDTEKIGKSHPAIELELENWLVDEVEKALAKKGFKISIEEKKLRTIERQDREYRQKIQRQLHEQFL